MDNDFYKPPQTELDLPPKKEGEFYVVSVQKFLLLVIATMGIYFVYWFYINWKNQMTATGEKFLPVMRGIFSIFFAYSLFKRIDGKLQQKKTDYVWSAGTMALFYIAASILGQLAAYVDDENIAMTMALTFIFFVPAVYAVYKAQVAINIVSDDPHGLTNSSYSGLNIFWIVLGAVFWLLTLLGVYVSSVDEQGVITPFMT